MRRRLLPFLGLPRSGSTLIATLLNQHKDITVSLDSDLPDLLTKISYWSCDSGTHTQLPSRQFRDSVLNFSRCGSENWVENNCDTNFFLSKSRYWLYNHPFMFKVFPETKMVVGIRDPRSVINSFLKRQHESIVIDVQKLYENTHENFLEQRIGKIFNEWYLNELLISIKDIIEVRPKYRDQILFVKYEDLIENPQVFMNKIYDFYEVPRIVNDFDNIEPISPHYDNMYQPYGDHELRSKLSRSKVNLEYLNNQSSQNIMSHCKWFYDYFYPDVVKSNIKLNHNFFD